MASLLKRGNTYYLQDRLSGCLTRWSRRTDSPQIAKEKLRQYESAQLRGLDNPLPTRTPIPEAIAAEDEFSVQASGSTDRKRREHRFKGSACETGSIPL